jgi:hypothetical protein
MPEEFERAMKYADKAILEMLNKCCAEGINPMGAITAMCSAAALTAGGLHNEFVRDNKTDSKFFIDNVLVKPFLTGQEHISIVVARGDGFNELIARDKRNKTQQH